MRGQREKGAALISAVILMALVATITLRATLSGEAALTRTALMQQGEQARLLTIAGENWLREQLALDRLSGELDHLGESWARSQPLLEIDGALITGQVIDLAGRLNVNALVQDGTVDAEGLQAFNRLSGSLGIGEGYGVALVDWILPDGYDHSLAPGDLYYLSKVPAYSRGGKPLLVPSEMRMIADEDQQRITSLLPYIAALPEPVGVNVNTAPRLVLAALLPELDNAGLDKVLLEREVLAFDAVANFMERLREISPGAVSGALEKNLAVGSQYFMMIISVQLGRARAERHSILYRNSEGETQVLLVSQGGF